MNNEGWPGIARSVELLCQNAAPFDVIEQGINLVEQDSRVRSVGYGGFPNALGSVQLDACLMDGDTLQCGSVGALEGFINPISVARQIMLKLPHVMLVGEGARRFAQECGFKEADTLSAESKVAYEQWRQKNPFSRICELFDPHNGAGCHGTVIALTRGANGTITGGVSTSGWDFKYPGRLGDSPIIGAGLYVDSRYGGAACTHCGENAIRTSLARSVVLYMKKGAAVQDAVMEGIDDLNALRGGYQGQVVIYAMDRNGEHFVAQRLSKDNQCRYLLFHDGMDTFETRDAALF